MNSYYRAIETTWLHGKPKLCHPHQPSDTSLDSAAEKYLVDFSFTKPVTISGSLSYDQVKEVLLDTHSEYALVENGEHKLVGLVTLKDLVGLRSMIKAEEIQQPLKELNARELMQPVNQLPAIAIEVVRHYRLGDIVATFKHQGTNYLLVTDNTGFVIQGLFSADCLSAALGTKIEISYQAKSVADIAQAINGHYQKV